MINMPGKSKKTIFQKLEYFVSKVFKTTLEVFLEALKLSPNAQGYVSGSVTELLIKKHKDKCQKYYLLKDAFNCYDPEEDWE